MTGRDLVAASLREIGALAAGETPAAQDATDGLATINRMIGSWSTEALLIYAYTAETALTLTSGQGSYTLGASGDITTRPMAIKKALIRDETSSPAIEFPIDILTLEEWAAISAKDTQSAYPRALYEDGGYPQRTLKLYPVPNAAHKLVLYTTRPLTTITDLDTDLSFPPGYEDALVYNGAVRLAPSYGKAVSADLGTLARESKANIKRANHRPSYLQCDPALVGVGRFSIQTGGHER